MNHETVRIHVAQALTRAVHPDTRRHLRAALDELDSGTPAPLRECLVCGIVGVAERIHEHDCEGANHGR